jgi:hypothetical protein
MFPNSALGDDGQAGSIDASMIRWWLFPVFTTPAQGGPIADAHLPGEEGDLVLLFFPFFPVSANPGSMMAPAFPPNSTRPGAPRRKDKNHRESSVGSSAIDRCLFPWICPGVHQGSTISQPSSSEQGIRTQPRRGCGADQDDGFRSEKFIQNAFFHPFSSLGISVPASILNLFQGHPPGFHTSWRGHDHCPAAKQVLPARC